MVLCFGNLNCLQAFHPGFFWYISPLVAKGLQLVLPTGILLKSLVYSTQNLAH